MVLQLSELLTRLGELAAPSRPHRTGRAHSTRLPFLLRRRSEETTGAALAAPYGILSAVGASAVIGWVRGGGRGWPSSGAVFCSVWLGQVAAGCQLLCTQQTPNLTML
jgi:hypothetical protein